MNLDTIASLQTDFGRIYDENFNLRDKKIYSQQIADFNERLKAIGISPNLKPKDLELKLQQEYEKAYELLKKVSKFSDADRPNDMPANTTLTPQQLRDLAEQADKRTQQKVDINAREKQTVEDFIKERQRIQSEIKAAEDAKVKLAGKVVFAKVILPEPLPLNEIEQEELEVLRSKATEETPKSGKTISPKVELINDLTIQIEEKIRPSLPTASEEEIEIIARTAAVEIVEKIAKPIAIELNIQTAIYSAINEDKQNVVATIVKDDELLTAAKNGSTLSALKIRNDELTSKLLIENLFRPKLAIVINGYSPEQIKVELTENRVDGQSEYQFDLGRGQESRIQILQNQDRILNSIQNHGQKFGYDSIGNSFTSYARTYLAEKTAAMPAGSIVKKAYSDPIVQSILAKYGLANSVVWETTAQSGQFARFLVKISPDTAGPIFSIVSKFTGTEIVTPIVSLGSGLGAASLAAQAAATTASVTFTGGVMAGEAFASGFGVASQVAVKAGIGGAISTALAGLGSWAGPVGAAIGAAIGVAIEKAISALKVWWTKHKEDTKLFFAVGAGGLGWAIGGPIVGGVGLLGGLAAAGMLGTFAAGAFGVLGLIGRSIGIAIATPVIITLLVIPPLVAFIMLVINNSAYVVPPGMSSSTLNGGADNPYMLVTKIASPKKLDNPTTPQQVIYAVSIKALKESLYNVRITAVKCTVLKKDGKKMVCPDEDVPPLEEGKSISPSQVHAFSFISRYDARFNDSLVIDSVEVTAETADGTTVTTSGSASICIGECPKNCAQVSSNGDEWPTKLAENVDRAIEDLSQYQGFTAKLCTENKPINLCYKPSRINPKNYAWHVSNLDKNDCDIYFNHKGISSQKDALFMITHELTHHIQAISSAHELSYSVSGSWVPEIFGKGFCTYSATNGVSLEAMREGMAEAAALYTNSSPSWDGCAVNYSSKYPKNYAWSKKFMEE